jgi:hypothetical protein
MTHNQLLSGLAVSTVVLGFGAAGVHSQTSDACAPFTVMGGSERSVEYLDLGNDGPGSGDMRIGRRALVDEAGNSVGYHRWVIVNLDAPPGPGARSESYSTHVLNLADGQIYYQVLAEVTKPPQDAGQVSLDDYTGIVVGGTGAYSFARGTIARSFGGGLKGTYTLNIRCD